MPPRSKTLLISIFIMLCLPVLHAGNRAYASAVVTATQWQQLTADSAFAYRNQREAVIPPKPPETNGLEQLIMAFIGLFSNGLGLVLMWMLVIAAVIFIVYKLLLSKDSILFGRSGKKHGKEEPPAEETEDIAATNWEALFSTAAQAGDKRLAVRYSYMWLLQMLQHKGLIAFSSDKTNFDYYSELGDTAYRQPFRQLSRRYEYAWYGRVTLYAPEYDAYLALFNDLKKQLGA